MKTNKKFKNEFLKTMIFLFVALFIVTSSSFAWFYNNKHLEASNIEIHITSQKYLQISWSGDYYGITLADSFDEGSKVLKQVASNGRNFYTANAGYQVVRTDGHASISDEYAMSYTLIDEEDLDTYIYRKEIYFKSETPLGLYLILPSSITPSNVEERMNAYNFSKDYIAGAIRFSLTIEDNGTDHTFIWAPNSTYQATGDSNDDYTFTPTGDVESSYTLVTGETTTYTINTSSATQGSSNPDSKTTFCWGNLSEPQLICNLNSGVTKAYVQVWLEGTDRECIADLAGGLFKSELYFSSNFYDSIPIESESTSEESSPDSNQESQ